MALYDIQDSVLIESYQKAIKLGLDDDFIDILKRELIRRNILTVLDHSND